MEDRLTASKSSAGVLISVSDHGYQGSYFNEQQILHVTHVAVDHAMTCQELDGSCQHLG